MIQSLLFTISCTQKQWRSYGVVPRYLIAYCHHEWVIMVTVAVYLQKSRPSEAQQVGDILLFLPDFSRSSCLWMAKTGDTCQLLHHRIATRRTHRGLMACCFFCTRNTPSWNHHLLALQRQRIKTIQNLCQLRISVWSMSQEIEGYGNVGVNAFSLL